MEAWWKRKGGKRGAESAARTMKLADGCCSEATSLRDILGHRSHQSAQHPAYRLCYIQRLLDGVMFKQTVYALDRDSRKAALARFLQNADRWCSSGRLCHRPDQSISARTSVARVIWRRVRRRRRPGRRSCAVRDPGSGLAAQTSDTCAGSGGRSYETAGRTSSGRHSRTRWQSR
ncbi:MAG: integrase family protein [Proteobacteria bacterium]|nr:integrase family protein [Pseudomonadota bacterium]